MHVLCRLRSIHAYRKKERDRERETIRNDLLTSKIDSSIDVKLYDYIISGIYEILIYYYYHYHHHNSYSMKHSREILNARHRYFLVNKISASVMIHTHTIIDIYNVTLQ